MDYILHTFPFKTKLQYLGLSLENAEFLAPLFSSQHPVLSSQRGKCELRDVMYTLAVIELSSYFYSWIKLY